MATKKAGKEVENTTCYTYKIEMLVQVLAKDEATAFEQLEKSGGYVTDRQVNLMDSVSLYNGEKGSFFISRPFKGGWLPKVANNPVRALKPSQGIFMAYSRKQLRCENGVSSRRSTFFALIALYDRYVLNFMHI